MTARQEILEVARSLTTRGLSPFSPKQIVDELRRRGTRYAESTIRTHVVDFMCIDSPSSSTVAYPDLRRVGRGQYVLADSAERGAPRGRASEAPPRAAHTSQQDEPARSWMWEGNVQQVFVDHLRDLGWEVVATADTASREAGPDVHARCGPTSLYAEVKGYPEREGASTATQARNYAAGALLTALLAWADQPAARIGLVFPEAQTFTALARRLRAPLERLGISVWFVHADGTVTLWLDGDLPHPAPGDGHANAPPSTPTSPPDSTPPDPPSPSHSTPPAPPPSDDAANGDDLEEQARRLGEAMREDIRALRDEVGYRATRWAQMIDRHGPVEAARRLLRGPDVSDGFVTLWEHGRLDQSVEWGVLSFPELFDAEERRIAYERLRQYDAPVDDWLADRLGRRRP